MLDGMESSDEHDEGDFICLAGEREKKCPHGRFDSRDSCNFHYRNFYMKISIITTWYSAKLHFNYCCDNFLPTF